MRRFDLLGNLTCINGNLLHFIWSAQSHKCCGMQYPTCLDLLDEGKIDCEPLITHRFGFSEKEIVTGFDTAAAAAKTGAIKVMFNW